jgi:vesicle-fusing ATPase
MPKRSKIPKKTDRTLSSLEDSFAEIRTKIEEYVPDETIEFAIDESNQSLRVSLTDSKTTIAVLKDQSWDDIKPGIDRATFAQRIKNIRMGGIGAEVGDILRRVFAPRILGESSSEKLGIDPVKGMIIHGPPGTGKTLLARNLSQVLNPKSLKIVNGPEILDAYVGVAERNTRSLFTEAEADTDPHGLHVVIIDEIDSLCRTRGQNTSTSPTFDNVVNQMLAKMDGIRKINNLLMIGLTNRLDLIDKALLRPGRFELIVKLSLPDLAGRAEIFGIHMERMIQNKSVSGVNTKELAALTNNFSGAEISGVVKNAASHAINRYIDGTDTDLKIKRVDFIRAIEEATHVFRNKSFPVEEPHRNITVDDYAINLNVFFVNERDSENIAKSLATKLRLGNLELITNYDLIGLDSYGKSKAIKDRVSSALVTGHSVIVFVRVEEIIDFFPIRNHFDIPTTQTIRTIMAKQYDKEIKFVVSSDIGEVGEILFEKASTPAESRSDSRG